MRIIVFFTVELFGISQRARKINMFEINKNNWVFGDSELVVV